MEVVEESSLGDSVYAQFSCAQRQHLSKQCIGVTDSDALQTEGRRRGALSASALSAAGRGAGPAESDTSSACVDVPGSRWSTSSP